MAGAAESAVEFAAQTGRLDLVSVLLAIVAILLGLGGFVAFFSIRGLAKSTAHETATATAEAIAEKAAISHLEAELPKIVKEYFELVQNSVTAEQARAIAEAQDEKT